MTATSSSDRPFDDDPVLGRYLAHYVSDRRRLITQAGLAYATGVIFIQLLFADASEGLLPFVVIALFAALSLAAGWYVLHLWNREVVLYERGFTYREGSNLGVFHYAEIVSVRQQAERVRYLGFWRRDLYRYTLRSQHDETLRLDNLYQYIAELGLRLEKAISAARLPVIEQRWAAGESIDFGGGLRLRREGIELNEGSGARELFWHELGGHSLQGGRLVLRSRDGSDWAAVPLDALENLLLLLNLLKARAAS